MPGGFFEGITRRICDQGVSRDGAFMFIYLLEKLGAELTKFEIFCTLALLTRLPRRSPIQVMCSLVNEIMKSHGHGSLTLCIFKALKVARVGQV